MSLPSFFGSLTPVRLDTFYSLVRRFAVAPLPHLSLPSRAVALTIQVNQKTCQSQHAQTLPVSSLT